MKHLEELLASAGWTPLPPHVISVVEDHVRWLLDTNHRINLTAVTDEDEAMRLHALDALAALSEVESAVPGPLLDLGTGGGLPGLPLAVASGRTTVLLDSVGKKAAAVTEFLESRSLDGVTAVAARAEELATVRPGEFAVVVARAVTSLPALVELASPLLMRHGMLVAFKGSPPPEEVARGDAAAILVGMRRTGLREYELPGGRERRSLLTYQRVGRPTVGLPRRTGMAQKKPLA